MVVKEIHFSPQIAIGVPLTAPSLLPFRTPVKTTMGNSGVLVSRRVSNRRPGIHGDSVLVFPPACHRGLIPDCADEDVVAVTGSTGHDVGGGLELTMLTSSTWPFWIWRIQTSTFMSEDFARACSFLTRVMISDKRLSSCVAARSRSSVSVEASTLILPMVSVSTCVPT